MIDSTPVPPAIPRGFLIRYRVMAYVTAVLLIVLVFAGIPLQVAAGRPEVVNVVGTLHGFLYIIYLVVAFSLSRRLGIPRWQMALVLLAGTVPFCAFVAERKLTRRYLVLNPQAVVPGGVARRPLRDRATKARQRWLSRRALLLHLGVVVLAPGCALAGWWQATRALAGNDLSWVYSIEWPIFALLAIGGWWQLVHESPEQLRARKAARREDDGLAGTGGTDAVAELVGMVTPGDADLDHVSDLTPQRAEVTFDRHVRHATTRLIVATALEALLGIMCVLSTPFDRPSGWVPAEGAAIYITHAIVGAFLVAGAIALLVRVRGPRHSRTAKGIAWMGATGVLLAGLGGLMTAPQQVVRFLGMALMCIGTLCAGASYLAPAVLSKRQRSEGRIGEPGVVRL